MRLNYRDWEFGCDVEATKRVYDSIGIGAPEKCGCSYCRNFVQVRQQAYPEEFLALLRDFGVLFNQETETYHLTRLDSGLHLYGGWFHFVGSIIKQHDRVEGISDYFTVTFLNKRDVAFKEFGNQPLVQIEFTTQVPWVIQDQEPN